MFYYLANKKPVDADGAIEGMFDSNSAHRYFLDLQKGEVGCIEANTKEGKESLARLAGEGARYRQLPRISDAQREKWIRQFTAMFVEEENPAFAKRLRVALEKKGFEGAHTLLERKEDWHDLWHEWEGDAAFEELGVWLERHIKGFTYELKGCGDCEICRAAENGASLEELREAFEEERKNDDGSHQSSL
jgi:hypothetical protein